MQLVLLTSLGDASETIGDDLVKRLCKPVRRNELLDCLGALSGTSPAVRPVEREAPASEGPWTGTRVLLVEDSPVNLEVAQRMLENWGCNVEVAVNGRDALAKHEANVFDVILMDCQMPELDGFEATATIRRRECEGGMHTPIIALTANAIQGDREMCLKAGMDDYLSKPFTSAQLAAVLEAVLRSDAGGRLTPANSSVGPLAGPSAATAGVVVLDEKVLTALRDLQRAGRPDIVKRTIDLYLEDAPRLLLDLHHAAESHNVAALGRASHTLKSSSANVGATRLAAACNELETLARTGMIGEAGELVSAVVAEYAAAKAALSTHLDRAA
jgi:CheY-like chemotaxis protein/HPt (histidine-containing phosphotransfer) domain-containing protein